MMVLVSLALAAPPEAYPWRTELTLPARGVARVHLPGELAVDVDQLPTTLRISDARGDDVPYAVLSSARNPEPRQLDLDISPVDTAVWRVDAAPVPLDAIQFEIVRLTDVTGVWVRVSDGEWTSPPTLLFAAERDGSPFAVDTVTVPHRAGPFTVTLQGLGDEGSPRLWEATGVAIPPETTPPLEESFEAPPPVLTEEGRARWMLELPAFRKVTSVTVVAEGDVFEREVYVGGGADADRGLDRAGFVRRLRVGERDVDLDTVGTDLVSDTLLVEIPTDRGTVLPVSRFVVRSVAVDLLVRDAGGGPHLLYAGSLDRDTPHDIALAAGELLRGPVTEVDARALTPNPTWVPVPTREGIDLGGPTVNLARYRWARPIEAPRPGWVKLPLDVSVFGHARGDLGDLRVVDAEGRSLPFLVRPDEQSRADVTPERTEVGGRTRLTVPVLAEGVPVERIELHTSQGRFRRQVAVLRDRGRMTETVRAVEWSSEAEGSTLSLALGDVFPEALLVEIDNGDNPPLPVDRVTLIGPGKELRVRVPEGGARLVYGMPAVSPPIWDLALLEAEVWGMPVAPATLGAEVALDGPALQTVDRMVVLLGIGVLAVGMAGMAIRAIRTVPQPEAAEG